MDKQKSTTARYVLAIFTGLLAGFFAGLFTIAHHRWGIWWWWVADLAIGCLAGLFMFAMSPSNTSFDPEA